MLESRRPTGGRRRPASPFGHALLKRMRSHTAARVRADDEMRTFCVLFFVSLSVSGFFFLLFLGLFCLCGVFLFVSCLLLPFFVPFFVSFFYFVPVVGSHLVRQVFARQGLGLMLGAGFQKALKDVSHTK